MRPYQKILVGTAGAIFVGAYLFANSFYTKKQGIPQVEPVASEIEEPKADELTELLSDDELETVTITSLDELIEKFDAFAKVLKARILIDEEMNQGIYTNVISYMRVINENILIYEKDITNNPFIDGLNSITYQEERDGVVVTVHPYSESLKPID